MTILRAQEIHRCGTAEYLQLQEAKHPGTIQRLKDARVAAEQWMQDHPGEPRTQMIIPVVVHVVYHTAAQNISDLQIQSQIDVLNEDFNRLNADTFKTPGVWKTTGAGLPVKFCLAVYDPNGDSTSGITRTQTDVDTFDLDDRMKYNNQGGEDGWPSGHYLNIWVCNIINGILGYTSYSPGDSSDGVVVLYHAFGRVGNIQPPYDKGRTCTHEVGHWLSLFHTWGDDGGDCSNDDNCNDTPREADSIMGCRVFPYLDQCSGAPNGVMFMNYMDYTDDGCMNIFTQCQVSRMQGVLNTWRDSILSSPAGCQPLKYHLDAGISTIAFPYETIPTEAFLPRVQLTNHGIDNIMHVQIHYHVDGQPDSTYDYEGNLASELSTLVILPPYFTGEGGHLFYAWTLNPNYGNDQFLYNDTSNEEFFVRSDIPKNTTTISVEQESPTDDPMVTIHNPSAPIMHLRVVNILGQIVQEGNWSVIDNPAFRVDLSNVPNGVYFLYGKIGYDYVKKKVMVLRN
ncbi:MAG TPA: M43 family zinc metalloprotease [Chitinophagales bacterium]|nr:M43 family zinc metalloprotease [Chitinophagales bacterium]